MEKSPSVYKKIKHLFVLNAYVPHYVMKGAGLKMSATYLPRIYEEANSANSPPVPVGIVTRSAKAVRAESTKDFLRGG